MAQLQTRADPEPAALPQAEPAQPETTERLGTFAALRLGNFRLLLTGTTLSNAAQWIQQVTLGWLVYDLTGSGTMLGSINLVRSIATLGLAPVAGVAIDRFPRRTLMLAVNGWLFAISLTLALLLLTGHRAIGYLFAFTFLGGIAQAIDMPLRQTIVFTLVPRHLAPNAVALVQTGWAVMRSLGPAVGGVLILHFGAGGNFLVQAAAYVLIALTITRMTFPPGQTPGRQAAMRNLGDGIRYIAREPTTRALVMMSWVLPVLIIPNYSALPPIFAKDVFHGGPDTLGLLLASVGVGGIIGGLVSASISRVERRGVVQLLALALTGTSLIGFGLSTHLWLGVLTLAASGFFEMIYITSSQTMLQLAIPDELRGRVMGVVSLNAGLSPLGAFVAGASADLVGPRAVTIIFCSLAVLIALAVLLTVPIFRDYRLSRAMGTRREA